MDKKASLPISLCMRLISLHPEKQDIRLPPELDDDRINPAWKIFQSLSGEIFIKNISVPYLRVDNILLEIDQEKELFGGERLSFDHDKDPLEPSFDYVFFFMKPQPDFKRDRNEVVEPEKMKKLVKIANDLPKELICGICTNFLHKCMVLVPCQHTFCSSCLFDHLKLSSECPLCRTEAVSVAKNPVLSNVIQLVEDSFPALHKPQERKELEDINIGGAIVRNVEGVYVGSCVNGKRDGQGKFIEKEGTIYEGSWRNDKREGKGVTIWDNGDKYDGNWRNNIYHGRGKYLWKDGEVYEGDFQENELSGYATMKYEDGRVYQGEWKKNKREGSGILTFSNGDKNEGKWEDDILQPEVKVEYLNGDKYEGEIDVGNLKKQGNGILTFLNGDKCKGTWVDNILQQKVIIEYSNGDHYDGEINVENFQKQGEGVLILSNGDKYDGNWVNDKQHGSGILICKGGQLRYEGLWEDGKLTGDGVMVRD